MEHKGLKNIYLFKFVMNAACVPLAGLFYGLEVLPGKRNDSFSEIPRDELDGE